MLALPDDVLTSETPRIWQVTPADGALTREDVVMLDIVRGNHGSLFDRGSADSYYGRYPEPHYGGVGGNSGPRVAVSDQASVDEYMQGYDYNEKYGDKKRWDWYG